MTLATILCRVNILRAGECEYTRKFEDGRVYQECIHCGDQTPGWETAHSPAWVDEVYDDLMAVELDLHCGG